MNTHLQNTEMVNVAKGGRSNAGIFQDAVYNILRLRPKYAFVEWTNMPRIEFHAGLELYETKCIFLPNGALRDIDCNTGTYTKSYLESIRDRLLTTMDIHYEILNLIYYVNALVLLAETIGTKLIFINGLCNWDRDYFQKLETVVPEEFTPFTKDLINIKNRDDSEILGIYNKIHNEYNAAGGIHEKSWVNLHHSFRSLRIDTNDDNVHPGVLSNEIYSNLINSYLDEIS